MGVRDITGIPVNHDLEVSDFFFFFLVFSFLLLLNGI